MTLARIYLADRESGKWQPLMAAPKDSGNVVQMALANSPELIPGDQIDPENPCRWLLVESASGDPDTATTQSMVLLDQNAIPTFVVNEDSGNHNLTVASMIGLATRATATWTGDKLRQAAGETAIKQDDSLEERLLMLLGGEPDEEAYWTAVDDNLRRRQMRLIIVSDAISDELWQMLQFLDGTMSNVQVLALEMRQYRAAGQIALLPRMIGQSNQISNGSSNGKSEEPVVEASTPSWLSDPKPAIKRKKPVPPKTTAGQPKIGSKPLADNRFSAENSNSWNEITFFSDLSGRSEEAQVLVGKQIFNWAKKNTSATEWGGGSTRGAFAPIYEQGPRKCQLFVVTSNGWVELNLRGYQHHPPYNKAEKLQRFYEKLSAIENLDLPAEALEKRALLPLSLFTAPSRLAQFLKVFEWAMVNMESSTGELRPARNPITTRKPSVSWPLQDDAAESVANSDFFQSYESSFDDLLNRKRVELDDDETDDMV